MTAVTATRATRPSHLRSLTKARFYDMLAYLNSMRKEAGLPAVTFFGTSRDVLIMHIGAAERGEFRPGPQTARVSH